MEEQAKDPLIVRISLEQAIGAHNTKDFLQRAVTTALKENPSIIASQIQAFILHDLLKTELYTKLQSAVNEQITKCLSEIEKDSNFRMARDATIREAVKAQEGRISQVVQLKIQSEGFKESVGRNIAAIVERRVNYALGEVSDNCDRDFY